MNILVVDDEPVVGRSLDVALSSAGHAVTVIATPRVLEATFEGRTFDAAFVDFVMPALDGDVVTRWIRLNHPDTTVVAMSGLCDDETADRMKRNGAAAFLPKPFTRAEVLDVLRRLTRSEPRGEA